MSVVKFLHFFLVCAAVAKKEKLTRVAKTFSASGVGVGVAVANVANARSSRMYSIFITFQGQLCPFRDN